MSVEPPFRVGEWLESDTIKVNNWVGNIMLECMKQNEQTPLCKVVQDLKDFIEGDDEVLKLVKASFAEIPMEPPFDRDVMGNTQVRDYKLFLKIMNKAITVPPRYENNDFVGFPIYAIINWCIGTPSGCILFLHEMFNEHFKAILNEWSVFLKSSDSRLYMTEDPIDGWFGAGASSKLTDKDGNKAPFTELFVCDPTLPYFGFDCWDDYFTRKYLPSQRPVDDPEDNDKLCSPCESAPYKIATEVQKVDQFWIKGQPYSLRHMLKGEEDSVVDYFVGGTVYQAYLSAMNYHRWHSPVNGSVTRISQIAGSYYAGCPEVGFDASGCASQSYLTEVATRCLVFIQSDNAALGLVCFMAVGMGEVSTCEVTVCEGARVRKGDELGMFHFGGSTYCLIFGPHVKLLWELGEGNQPGLTASVIHLNKTIASVVH